MCLFLGKEILRFNTFGLSQQAEQDLEDIWVYLAQNNDEVTADLQIAKILDKLPMLAQFPSMGKKRDELLLGLRSFPVKPYIIFYKHSPKLLEIIRILHQSRDFNRYF